MTQVAKAGIVLTCLLVGLSERVAGAEKSRKSSRADSGTASMRTQQRTGDAMAKKVARPTTEPDKTGKPAKTDPVEDLKAQLAEVEGRIRAEDERYADAVSELRAAEEAAAKVGKDKSIAPARKSLDREKSTHERKRAALDEQRADLRRKLKLDDEPSNAPEAPKAPREAKSRPA